MSCVKVSYLIPDTLFSLNVALLPQTLYADWYMEYSTKLYIDGGEPEESRNANELLKKGGFPGLDGQTTNPTLIAKNLAAKAQGGKKLTMAEAIAEYRRIVTEIRAITPGPVSIQVLGDPKTLTAEDMLSQARDRNTWIENAVIKFPCTKEGLTAASEFCKEGSVNMTLVFSQDQAAAVYAATKYHAHDVYVSPFVGRLDDKGLKGMDVVANMLEMFKLGDGHVQVLTASVRSVDHIKYALWLKSNVITIPFKVMKEWADLSFPLPAEDYLYDLPGATEIPYKELNLEDEWTNYDIHHELTDAGLTKFWEDWSSVVE